MLSFKRKSSALDIDLHPNFVALDIDLHPNFVDPMIDCGPSEECRYTLQNTKEAHNENHGSAQQRIDV
jgi:hypothetical protein